MRYINLHFTYLLTYYSPSFPLSRGLWLSWSCLGVLMPRSVGLWNIAMRICLVKFVASVVAELNCHKFWCQEPLIVLWEKTESKTIYRFIHTPRLHFLMWSSIRAVNRTMEIPRLGSRSSVVTSCTGCIPACLGCSGFRGTSSAHVSLGEWVSEQFLNGTSAQYFTLFSAIPLRIFRVNV